MLIYFSKKNPRPRVDISIFRNKKIPTNLKLLKDSQFPTDKNIARLVLIWCHCHLLLDNIKFLLEKEGILENVANFSH